jgi:hypothetical protein
MDRTEDTGCKDNYSIKPPELTEITAASGIEITGNIFLLSPQGCCAQTVLPFWAKVIGTVKNHAQQEIMINVTVTLFNNENKALEQHSDIMIVDAGQKGEFDVKLPVCNKDIRKYSIKAEEMDEYI